MSNLLAAEPSLYLRQHADNPVHWRPWGAEAFAEARRLNKPVLVSVGYSACHWCHVMARESFEDTYVADLMNRHFVCVKVDREERPDVDKLMMDAVTMVTGRGGWPLNAFCLPDGRPFFGGTYFPPKDKGHGIIPWPQLLMRVADYWSKNRADLETNAASILSNITFQNKPEGASDTPMGHLTLIDAAKAVCSLHDDVWGGFGEAPKFPAPMSLRFLLAVRASAACDDMPALATRIDKVVTHTLRAMACGGIYDQLGGGFARYSVDAKWAIPHFEKMLYDNGQLLGAYAESWLRYRDPIHKAVCEETVAWLVRDMGLPGGGFAAALDADTDHHEGATYVWTPDQVRAVLGETDAKRFCAAYAIDARGNFEHGTTNPVFAAGDAALREELRPLREKLLAARAARPQPGRDTKVITAWNALVITGLAAAAWALGRKDWARLAADTSDFLWNHLFDETTGDLRAVRYGETGARHDGTLHDYAWLAEAELALAEIIEWAEPGRAATHIARATRLTEETFRRFGDSDADGFHLAAAHPDDPLAARQKEWWDNATPAGNSALAHVFSGLYALTGDTRTGDALTGLRRAYAGIATRAPHGVAHTLTAFARDALGVAVVKAGPGADLGALRAVFTAPGRAWRKTFLLRDPAVPAGRFRVCVGDRCLPDLECAEDVGEVI